MNEKKYSHLVPGQQCKWVSVDFGIKDNKGRAVGAYTTIGPCEFVEYNSELHRGYGALSVKPGHYFYFNRWSSRDGQFYGACQSSSYFKTEEEAVAAANKYLADAKKRAIKNFGAK